MGTEKNGTLATADVGTDIHVTTIEDLMDHLADIMVQCCAMQKSAYVHDKTRQKLWKADLQVYVDTCSKTIGILFAIMEGGFKTAREAEDLVRDYNTLAKQYQAMYKRHGTADKAVHKDGVWHCPNCNRRVTPGHSFCHWCGKKMEWWGNRKGGHRHG